MVLASGRPFRQPADNARTKSQRRLGFRQINQEEGTPWIW